MKEYATPKIELIEFSSEAIADELLDGSTDIVSSDVPRG